MKRKSYIPLIISLMLLVIFVYGCKKEISSTNPKSDFKINFTPAKTSNELLGLKANPQANIVTTLPGFDAMVSSYNTPFSKLSSEELQTFRKNLVFSENKVIVSIDFSMIKNKLSAEDFAGVMSYFGLDIINGYWGLSTNTKVLDDIRAASIMQADAASVMLTDYEGYYCASKGNCFLKTNNICLTGC